MARSNLGGGLTHYDGRTDDSLASAKRVAWKRQARAYKRLRQVIDDRYLDALSSRGDDIQLELPYRLHAWRYKNSAQVRELWPDLDSTVTEIERLLAQRAAQRADKTFIPASTHKRVPLPADKEAREVERLRRSVTAMRALRERRKRKQADYANRDLVGM